MLEHVETGVVGFEKCGRGVEGFEYVLVGV
jgi:hypothetical protein